MGAVLRGAGVVTLGVVQALMMVTGALGVFLAVLGGVLGNGELVDFGLLLAGLLVIWGVAWGVVLGVSWLRGGLPERGSVD